MFGTGLFNSDFVVVFVVVILVENFIFCVNCYQLYISHHFYCENSIHRVHILMHFMTILWSFQKFRSFLNLFPVI